MVKYLTSAPGFALAPGKAIGDGSALVLPDQPIMAHSGTSSPTTGRPCNMAQPAANGTSLFNGTDASTAPLRYALRALASEPDFLAAPHQVIARLRPRVDAEKRRLAQGRDMPGSPDERLRNWARLVDGAISGLTYLARVSVDADSRTVVAPFAVMAVGQYGARRCEPEGTLELQYLLPDDQGSREPAAGLSRSYKLVWPSSVFSIAMP
jgi:hypothetical protein